MSRNINCQAITLRVNQSGESNRQAWFLTSTEGIIKATVFGGPKSRLRSHVAPFHEGMIWIYHNPIKDTFKVTDFDVKHFRTGIRELYERIMAANAIAETILAFHGGGGNWSEASGLAAAVLDALDSADRDTSSRLAIYFLWHWSGILGLRHELSFASPSSSQGTGAGALSWLKKIDSLSASEIKRVSLDSASREEAKYFTQNILSDALGKRLSGWDDI